MITSAIIPIGLAFVSGPPGESAYQLWLDNGNTGTLQQYLATLVGPMGPPGPQGLPGPVGSQGYQGLQGPANLLSIGTVSNSGAGGSAAATLTGPAGNQTLSLTLPTGATGPQGPIGNTGPTGPNSWQVPPTGWLASTAYTATAPASVVVYAGQTYVCSTSHTSTASFDSTKFVLIAQKGADGSGAANTVRYDINQNLTAAQQLQGRQNLAVRGSGVAGYSAATTLPVTQAGYLIYTTGASSFTLTLPTVATMGLGAGYEYVNRGSGTVTFAVSDSATINYGVASATSVALLPGQGCAFWNDGTNWFTWFDAPIASALLADRAQSFTTAQQTQLAANLGLQTTPPGQIGYFAMNSAPSGWLNADGTNSYSRTTYAALYAAIGTTYGSSSGTTFGVPDLRGVMPRGLDNGRGLDSNRSIGSYQADSFASHGHSASMQASYMHAGGSTYWFPYDSSQGYVPVDNYGGVYVGANGGSETRGKNVALLACIKY